MKPDCDFETWWLRTGQHLPSPDSLPLSFDAQSQRRAVAEAAFKAGRDRDSTDPIPSP